MEEIDTMTKAKKALDALMIAGDKEPPKEVQQAAFAAAVFVFVDIADSLRAIAGRADD